MSMIWPYTSDGLTIYCCAQCRCEVPVIQSKHNEFKPKSLYWNTKYGEVYCSAEHSLLRHKETQP